VVPISDQQNDLDDYRFHPASMIVPLMEGKAFDILVADIEAHGLRKPCVLHQNQILDGRNRYKACRIARVACRFVRYTGNDPVAYVISHNVVRRHLNESQRAMVAARLATLRDGQRLDRQGAQICAATQAQAATRLNVSRRLVQNARKVLDHGIPDLVHAVDQGELKVSEAVKSATRLSPAQQAQALAEARANGKTLKTVLNNKLIATRNAAISRNNTELCAGTFDVIYADPPWQFDGDEISDRVTGKYPKMSTEDICRLPVATIAANDGYLFLWTTKHHFLHGDAMKVANAWGSKIVDWITLAKDESGVGRHTRHATEYLCICKRGNNLPAPPTDAVPRDWQNFPVRRQGEKPVEFYGIIERMTVGLNRRVELFARRRRNGWIAWGNQVPTEGGNGSLDVNGSAEDVNGSSLPQIPAQIEARQ
jgi:N6-adenosine-specific RNA methylase IME4